MYLQYRGAFDREPAAVLALLLVVLTILVLVGEQRARLRLGSGSRGGRTVRPARVVPLGRWRPAALAFCATVVGAGLVLPVGVLVVWLLRGSPSLDGLATATLHSLLVAVAAAAVTTLAALPVAVLATRFRSRWTVALERTGYAANALPGIVAALAFVFFAARHARPSTSRSRCWWWPTSCASSPRPSPGSHRRSRVPSPASRRPRAAWAGGRPTRGHGDRSARGARPAGRRALVLLSTLKELPATLILRPSGFDTLATDVWTATSVTQYSQAAVPALMLCVLAAPAVWLLVVRGSRGLDPLGN